MRGGERIGTGGAASGVGVQEGVVNIDVLSFSNIPFLVVCVFMVCLEASVERLLQKSESS